MKTSIRLLGLGLLLGLLLPTGAQAQFTFTTNADNTLTITGYTGTNPVVIIPDTTNGYSVVSIGSYAFYDTIVSSVTIGINVTNIGDNAFYTCTNLNSMTIPNNVISIGNLAFNYCPSLTNVTIPDSITSIGFATFDWTGLTSVVIPNSVTNIGGYAFYFCESLTNVTIGNNVNSIGYAAFASCANLLGVYFKGNAPSVITNTFNGNDTFSDDTNTIVYFLPGTTGWGALFGGLPAVRWNPQVKNDASFGVRTNRFGFAITGTTNIPIVVEACTNLSGGAWTPLQTCTVTNGSIYFTDPAWTNHPTRLYRLRSP